MAATKGHGGGLARDDDHPLLNMHPSELGRLDRQWGRDLPSHSARDARLLGNQWAMEAFLVPALGIKI
uniref:Uncharacterized protein n=1 Tax=Oryza brachyantha TaxID=4533 RepID=J3L021_ORYBR